MSYKQHVDTLKAEEKRPLDTEKEQTSQGIHYRPPTDIFEDDDALILMMEIPGVDREGVDIHLEQSNLTVMARFGLNAYSNLRPLHVEYEVGHFTRTFKLANTVDQNNIQANVEKGVLTLKLPKLREPTPRQIKIS